MARSWSVLLPPGKLSQAQPSGNSTFGSSFTKPSACASSSCRSLHVCVPSLRRRDPPSEQDDQEGAESTLSLNPSPFTNLFIGHAQSVLRTPPNSMLVVENDVKLYIIIYKLYIKIIAHYIYHFYICVYIYLFKLWVKHFIIPKASFCMQALKVQQNHQFCFCFHFLIRESSKHKR